MRCYVVCSNELYNCEILLIISSIMEPCSLLLRYNYYFTYVQYCSILYRYTVTYFTLNTVLVQLAIAKELQNYLKCGQMLYAHVARVD